MTDTTSEVRKKMIQIIAELSPQQRLEKSGGLFESGRQLAEIAVTRRTPHLKGLDLKLAVFRLMYRSVLTGEFLDEIEQHARAVRSETYTLSERSESKGEADGRKRTEAEKTKDILSAVPIILNWHGVEG